MIQIYRIGTLILSCFWLASCSNPEKNARNELERRQYRFASQDFLRAAARGDIEALLLFGKAGIDVNTSNSKGRSALMEASKHGQGQAVTLLLGAGANPVSKDLYGRDSLIDSAGGGHLEVCKQLLQVGAGAATRDDAGWTSLSLSAYNGHSDVVALLAGKAPKRHLDESLLLASANGDAKTVAHILNQGADINTKSPQNLSSLMIAADKGNVEVVSLLIENRADPKLTGRNGITALGLAQVAGHNKIVQLLKGEVSKETALEMATERPENKPLVALNGSTIRTAKGNLDVLKSFKLVSYQEQVIPVSLNAVFGDQAVIRHMGEAGKITDIKVSVGDLISGTNYKLESIQGPAIRQEGFEVGQNRVRIEDVKIGHHYILEREQTRQPKDKTAVISSPQSRYRFVAKAGDLFTTSTTALLKKQYRVEALSDKALTLRELDGNNLVLIQ